MKVSLRVALLSGTLNKVYVCMYIKICICQCFNIASFRVQRKLSLGHAQTVFLWGLNPGVLPYMGYTGTCGRGGGVRRYPFLDSDGERHCESKLSCLRIHHNIPAWNA